MMNSTPISFFLIWSALYCTSAWGESPYACSTAGYSPAGKELGNYFYDSAGNRLANGHGQHISMGLVTKPVMFRQDKDVGKIKYEIGGKRYLRVHEDGRRTLYIGNVEYRIPSQGDGSPQTIVRIQAQGYSPDVQVDATNSNAPLYSYFIKDAIGSPVCAVDNAGNPVKRTRFDAWGQMSQPTGVAQTFNDPKTIKAAEDFRGFTGHETMAYQNFSHMNGRIYDPVPHQFLGPDKHIQGRSTTSLNRFAYAHLNPLTHSDPSGWVIEGMGLREDDIERMDAAEAHEIRQLTNENQFSAMYLIIQHLTNSFRNNVHVKKGLQALEYFHANDHNFPLRLAYVEEEKSLYLYLEDYPTQGNNDVIIRFKNKKLFKRRYTINKFKKLYQRLISLQDHGSRKRIRRAIENHQLAEFSIDEHRIRLQHLFPHADDLTAGSSSTSTATPHSAINAAVPSHIHYSRTHLYNATQPRHLPLRRHSL